MINLPTPLRISHRRFSQLIQAIIVAAILALLFHAYRSTDFRDAVALTSDLPAETAALPVTIPSPQPPTAPVHPPHHVTNTRKKTVGKEKATLLMLVRNRELNSALESMRKIEDRFNRNYHYPWTFLNDRAFSPEFIRRTTGLASGPVEYVVIPKSHWSIPPHINRTEMRHGMQTLIEEEVIYAGSTSYRHMCRFNSGFFMHQEQLKKYDWYWRVEPDIDFYCDINYDPFEFMRREKKVYGFVITMYELPGTVKSLWNTTKQFVQQHPEYLAKNNALNFITDLPPRARSLPNTPTPELGDRDYNLCHFWSNFEIASLDFFRGEAYTKYFQHLDQAGGFFYERWGDAPVHTLALSLFVDKSKLHHFADMGYRHTHAARCPQDEESHESGRCVCDREKNWDVATHSCMPRWFRMNGVGKGAVFDTTTPKRKKMKTKKQKA